MQSHWANNAMTINHVPTASSHQKIKTMFFVIELELTQLLERKSSYLTVEWVSVVRVLLIQELSNLDTVEVLSGKLVVCSTSLGSVVVFDNCCVGLVLAIGDRVAEELWLTTERGVDTEVVSLTEFWVVVRSISLFISLNSRLLFSLLISIFGGSVVSGGMDNGNGAGMERPVVEETSLDILDGNGDAGGMTRLSISLGSDVVPHPSTSDSFVDIRFGSLTPNSKNCLSTFITVCFGRVCWGRWTVSCGSRTSRSGSTRRLCVFLCLAASSRRLKYARRSRIEL